MNSDTPESEELKGEAAIANALDSLDLDSDAEELPVSETKTEEAETKTEEVTDFKDETVTDSKDETVVESDFNKAEVQALTNFGINEDVIKTLGTDKGLHLAKTLAKIRNDASTLAGENGDLRKQLKAFEEKKTVTDSKETVDSKDSDSPFDTEAWGEDAALLNGLVKDNKKFIENNKQFTELRAELDELKSQKKDDALDTAQKDFDTYIDSLDDSFAKILGTGPGAKLGTDSFELKNRIELLKYTGELLDKYPDKTMDEIQDMALKISFPQFNSKPKKRKKPTVSPKSSTSRAYKGTDDKVAQAMIQTALDAAISD